jgi:transcriptional regulator with XRE-family HTH domain
MPSDTRPSTRRGASRRVPPDRTSVVVQPGVTKESASESLGPELRLRRERAGLTVREFARRVGVSPSLISQVERGLATPSVGTLLAISNELGLEIGDIFKFGSRTGQTTPGPVLRSSSRKKIRLASGVSWERLTSAPDPEVEFLYAVYDVGSTSCEKDSMLRHGGKEYGYLLSGRLGVKIGFEEYELGPGDAISFDAQLPHRLWCIGARPAVAIWAVVRRHGDARQALDHTADGG